ncbi:MAG: hypothetical protein ACTHJW_08435 [Streptosporangiaceae bacterium]
MKRFAIIVGVVAAVVLVIGIVEDITNYKWSAGDQNAFFGNPRLLMNDGTTAMIVGGILLLVAAVVWLAASRKGQSDQRQRS